MWQSTTLLVVLYVIGKVAARVFGARRWHSFGRADLVALAMLALVVGTVAWYAHRRMQRDLDEVQRRRQHAEALVAENAAVVRVARAIVEEFAQPLSGALSYSG